MNYYFATVARGLEPLAAQELERLGAQNVEPQFCGVSFQGDRTLLYQVNLWARSQIYKSMSMSIPNLAPSV